MGWHREEMTNEAPHSAPSAECVLVHSRYQADVFVSPSSESDVLYPAQLHGASLDLGRGVTIGAGAWHVLVERRVLGVGESVFAEAVRHTMTWQLHGAAGVSVFAPAAAAPGARVDLSIGLGTLHVPASSEVVAEFDEPRDPGLAYGTLSPHPSTERERSSSAGSTMTG